jgi:very-short-patch-repair endonuclease
MGSPDVRLAEFAARHHGLFRAADADEHGLTRRQLTYRVRQGRIERLGPGVFRMAGVPVTRDQRLLSAAWRSDGTISHRTAIEVHELVDRLSGRPHVTVRAERGHVFPDVVGHRSRDLLDREITTVREIPVTTVARSLVDCGLTVTEAQLEKAVHRALHRGLTSITEVAACYRRISAQGRNGAGPIGDLLRAIDPAMAPAESELEVELLAALRRHGVQEPVRQFEVRVDGNLYRLDLAYPEHRVFLEGDGFGVHGGRSAFESDRLRQNELVLEGWWPLRFTWRQITRSPEWCARTVARKLAEVERTW